MLRKCGVLQTTEEPMPKIVSPRELDAICTAVARFPNGAAIEDIAMTLGGDLPLRTLQRRIAALVAAGRLTAVGSARARRYHPAAPAFTIPATGSGKVSSPEELYLPISMEGEDIRRSVRRTIPERRPVGYDRNFLERYRPNETFYLSSVMREHLFEIGRSPDDERPAGTYARQIFDRLLIDLSWNSSRLEGNTYSLLETERLLELGESADGKKAFEAQMLLNHKAAIELLVEQADEIGFNRYTVLNLHALLSNNLLADPRACGRLRAIPVAVSGTVYQPLAVPQTIEKDFQLLLDTASAIADPFEQAFFVMVHLPYLQPFEDVNKRVSRLAANIPLIRRNLCPLSFIDVPDRAYVDGILGVYELNRVELLRDVFVWAYNRSCDRYSALRRSLGEPDPFRMRHRQAIAAAVAAVVTGALDKERGIALIKETAERSVLPALRPRFIEVVETELMSLHEGNIARYRIRPSQYRSWQGVWR